MHLNYDFILVININIFLAKIQITPIKFGQLSTVPNWPLLFLNLY